MMTIIIKDDIESGSRSRANERGKGVADEGDESGLDVDVDDLKMMEEGFTQLEIRLEGSTRTIVIPMDRDLLKNTEDVVSSLGPLCSDIEGKTLKELDDVTLLRSIVGLALKMSTALFDELKEKDDEMVKAIEKCSILQGMSRSREEDLEVSRGVEAQYSDLQAQMVELREQLQECRLQLEALNGEDPLAERENYQSTTKAKEDRLEEKIRELEKDNFILHDRVAVLEAMNAQLLAHPSSSHTSDFPNVSRELYEEWIHVEAQLDVFRDFHKAGFVSEIAL
ncbi:uncharacterized protein [Nicotiana sylvestris]|uniref:Myosin-9-like n=1 Tax=Nicotiana sylvestris TaxID=4096 RepID=A0A1U7VAB9_NICSY|nr:PREDICTED: myosin-9-like [Nicotiana sylvestris]